VPKELLRRLGFKSLATINGDLSDQVKDVLQLTDEEARKSQAAVQQLLASFRTLEAAGLKAVEPTRQELGRRAPEEVRVFEVPDLSDAFGELRATAHAALREALGPERAGLFEGGLSGWIPLTDEYNGTRSDQILFPTAKRLCFYRPGSGSHDLQWNIQVWFKGGSASMGVSYNPPEPYRQHVADWLELEKQLWQERRVPRAAIPGGQPQ
jgi:hypothetical protein